MTSPGFALFDTALGRCAVAWGARGILGVQLPEAHDGLIRSRMKRRFAGSGEAVPPPAVRRAIDAIVALLAGRPADLSGVALDMERTPEFDRRVYAIARGIGPGATLGYGEVAARLGDPALARAVGQALGRNPFAIVVPCHRVLAADGRLGGFSARGGAATKQRLLLIEGARTSTQPGLFDAPTGGPAPPAA
jgi:methylated-DNA-[protein]-cysteine S-methyltransferase